MGRICKRLYDYAAKGPACCVAEQRNKRGKGGGVSWQPIETAPKGSGEDGPERVDHPEYIEPPELLLWTEDGLEIGSYDWYYHKGYGYGGEERDSAWCNKHGEEISMPTHWMPLIDGPAGISKGKDWK